MDRISTFQSFIARSPADPFPRYGLAMEYKSQGRLDEARAAFVELLDGFPDYVPAYLQAGNVLVALGDRAGAVKVLRAGLGAAGAKGDHHARGELADALAELDPDGGVDGDG
ncbi:MAG: tetratricopeptide repeat protein [Kofleriaceae bacterium]|nr:tetratricopeptide repeat protein [Myxococcales bacterium]MCB9565140.1 tetratricopeptide repeat protein [Kofleriaceae bacterium]MCB9572211.1 tetratricopeptide repeat protein [Kofleriaceae bacterium]